MLKPWKYYENVINWSVMNIVETLEMVETIEMVENSWKIFNTCEKNTAKMLWPP